MDASPSNLGLPAEALIEVDGWDAEVAWSLTPERTVWRLRSPDGDIRYLKTVRRGTDLPLAAERDRLAWAAARLPVPRVLGYGADREQEWLLTAALPGVTAIDDAWRADRPRLLPLLAAGLRRLHALPVADCPFDCRLDKALQAAHERATAGLVDVREFHRDHAPPTIGAALARLEQLCPPDEDLVVCHGDYCLPNVLLSDGQVSGYLDLGQLGVADRWQDLAVATWSVTWNLGPGWEDAFLACYGVARDPRKQAFYRLLYEFTP